jgi:protein-disulfide isomerase
MGVMMTPALAIDGEIKVVGRVPTVENLKEILKNK